MVVLKNNVSFDDIKQHIKKLNLFTIEGNKCAGFSFIYGLKPDLLIVDKRYHPVAFLQHKLSAQSMSVKSYMPFAPEIQKYLLSKPKQPESINYIVRLLKCLFDRNSNGFSENDINYFNNKKTMLVEDEFFSSELFDKVFFGFSEKIKELLNASNTIDEYNNIINIYKRFKY